MLQKSFKYVGDFPYIDRGGIVSRVCNTQISSYNITGPLPDFNRDLLLVKKMKERRKNMKIVVVKAPKFLRGILKSIFKIKDTED